MPISKVICLKVCGKITNRLNSTVKERAII